MLAANDRGFDDGHWLRRYGRADHGSVGLERDRASAAETVVSFEGLAAGAEVKNQLQAQGIDFGSAEEFKQTPPPTKSGPGSC